jgi:hypothetical protein
MKVGKCCSWGPPSVSFDTSQGCIPHQAAVGDRQIGVGQVSLIVALPVGAGCGWGTKALAGVEVLQGQGGCAGMCPVCSGHPAPLAPGSLGVTLRRPPRCLTGTHRSMRQTLHPGAQQGRVVPGQGRAVSPCRCNNSHSEAAAGGVACQVSRVWQGAGAVVTMLQRPARSLLGGARLACCCSLLGHCLRGCMCLPHGALCSIPSRMLSKVPADRVAGWCCSVHLSSAQPAARHVPADVPPRCSSRYAQSLRAASQVYQWGHRLRRRMFPGQHGLGLSPHMR